MKKPIIIASGPVIIENDKVLLNKHGDDGFWKFVGGRVEDYSVSLEETAEREVMEEMGIGVNLIKPLKPMLIELPNKIVVLIHYLAERRGKIKPGEDILAWDWFDINNLPLDSAPNIKPVIKEYLESKNVDK
ncbi:MAG: NUDIX domain-containing protein [Patescibacteria group bacterium]|jgi:ADP-ribose pyrophosphatase YjhB (NUDIX family)|nr:NUDIX domain-containing protein [Patescibacteria group bacterium]